MRTAQTSDRGGLGDVRDNVDEVWDVDRRTSAFGMQLLNVLGVPIRSLNTAIKQRESQRSISYPSPWH